MDNNFSINTNYKTVRTTTHIKQSSESTCGIDENYSRIHELVQWQLYFFLPPFLRILFLQPYLLHHVDETPPTRHSSFNNLHAKFLFFFLLTKTLSYSP